MKKILNFATSRLKEGSTWRGLVLVLTALGVGITPALAEAITAAGVGIFGLLQMLKKEPLSAPETELNEVPEKSGKVDKIDDTLRKIQTSINVGKAIVESTKKQR